MVNFPRLSALPLAAPIPGEPIGEDSASAWKARLRLCFARRDDRTVLAARRQQGPLTVQRPFYPEGSVCHVYLLHPPGGLVGGDQLRLEVGVGIGAHALITTPGAGKIYRSAGATALQRQYLEVGPDGILEWLPQENILFDAARARIETRVTLHQRARFVGWDISCLGRPAAGEGFTHGKAQVSLAVYHGDRPQLLERLDLGRDADLPDGAGLRGHAVNGTFLASGANPDVLRQVRSVLDTAPELATGATLLENLLVVRGLAQESEPLRRLWSRLWETTRPLILDRAPCPPRIWAT